MFISVIKMLLLQIVNVWSLISHTGIRLPVGWHIKKIQNIVFTIKKKSFFLFSVKQE